VQQAVALTYEAHSVAPRVVAKGEGLIAEAILNHARELGVPLKSEPEMVSLLMQLELDNFIPPALYLAVAEILVWAYQTDARIRPGSTLGSGTDSIGS
jgi:flagellar biosynthesis protein